METSFFSGSENLYKYLVTVGTLIIVLTVYYPLKEKQDLEVLSIKIENDLQILNFKILDNQKELEIFKSKDNGKISKEIRNTTIKNIKEINKLNQINQIAIENKNSELKCRKSYINIYNFLFWVFIPIGSFLIIFGFIKWNKTKKIDDEMLELEKKKLKHEVDNLT